MIDLLCRRLLTAADQPRFLDALNKNRTRLLKVAQMPKTDDQDEYWRVLELICLYHTQYGNLPAVSGLRDFVKNSTDTELNESWTTALKNALRELTDMDEVRLKQASDPNIIVDAVINDGRKAWMVFLAKRIADIARNGSLLQTERQGKASYMRGKKALSGVDDAKAFLYQALVQDVTVGDAISGSLRQNADCVVDHLQSLYATTTVGNIDLGFKQLDDAFLVGEKFNKLLTILGFSNEGKSLFQRTLAFNAALQGRKTLYVTLEGEDALDCLTKFAFLYGSYHYGKPCMLKEHGKRGCVFWMPSYENFKKRRCTADELEHVMFCMKMLRDCHDIPLFVHDRKTINTWEQIEAAVEAHGYECVFIDYMALLQMPGVKEKDRDFAVNGLFDKASDLCGRKNIVVCTPVQCNREGKKQADSKDPHQERIYGMVHVSKYSRAYENADIMLGVVSSPEMKQLGEIKIEILKVREGEYPDDFFADVNNGTKHIQQLPGAALTQGKEYAKTLDRAAYDAEQLRMQDEDESSDNVIDPGLVEKHTRQVNAPTPLEVDGCRA